MKYLILSILLILFFCQLHAQSWKQAAEDSIIKYRTSPVYISIVDENGLPAEGVSVKVKMIQHEFKWGTAVSISQIERLVGNNFKIGDYQPYYDHFRFFNSVTPENAGKWKGWLDNRQRQTYLKTMDWFASQGIANRGHACVWESVRFNAVPDFLYQLPDTAAIRNAVKSHIIGQMNVLKDYVYEIDVVNELVHEQEIVGNLLKVKDRAIEHSHWYKWAKAAAPNVDLIVNEFDLFQSGNNFYQNFISYVQKMIEDGAPIDGVGMQGHFWSDMPEWDELKKRINQVKVLGLPMAVTEFDMRGSSYTDMERVLYSVFSEPQIYGFTMWGAWDGNQWRNNGPVFGTNWNVKPGGKAWFDLVHGKWWTDSVYVTDNNGLFHVNAFKGSHIVELKYNNKVFVDTFFVSDEMVEIALNTRSIRHEIPNATISIENDQDKYNIYQPARIVVNSNMPDSIAKVELFDGIFMQHADFKPPFEYEFTTTAAQTKNIYAKITCKSGYIFYTDTVDITFVNENAFPMIHSVYPFPNQFFILGTEVTVACEATDYENQMWKVELSGLPNDSVLIAYDSPYKFTLSNLDPGTYQFQLKALDSLYAFDQKQVNFTIIDPDAPNVAVSSPLQTDSDVEELADGSIVTEGDLDMGEKMTGIYFANLGIPANAIIDSAFIQFTADNIDVGEITIPIFAELSASPQQFSTQSRLSERSPVTQTISWSPATWAEAGEKGPDQKTPDLSAVLNELNQLENWNESSPVAMILGFSEPGVKRRAVSYDIKPEDAPQLMVYYRGGFNLSRPEPPTGLNIVTTNGNQVTFSWDKAEDQNVIGYFIYVNGEKFNPSAHKQTSFSLTNLAETDSVYVTAISKLSIESLPGNIVSLDNTTEAVIKDKHEINIFPNPFRRGIFIQNLNSAGFKLIDIYDQSGKLVRTLNRDDSSQYVYWDGKNGNGGQVPGGTYFVRIISQHKPVVFKIIKH